MLSSTPEPMGIFLKFKQAFLGHPVKTKSYLLNDLLL